MLRVNTGDLVRFRTFANKVKDLLRGMNRTLSRSREESSRDGKLFCSGCKSGLLSFGASDPVAIQPTRIRPNRQGENDHNQEMQERQREVRNVYTITRSSLMSLRLVFLAPMKTPWVTVVRRAMFEFQRSRRLAGLRVAVSTSRQECQQYEE